MQAAGRIWEDATPDVLAAIHQTWLRDPATGNYLLDVFRELVTTRTSGSAGDGPGQSGFPYRDIIHRSHDGIPYLAPELVLLYLEGQALRAGRTTGRLRRSPFQHMTPAQRDTLAELLARVHPGQPLAR